MASSKDNESMCKQAFSNIECTCKNSISNKNCSTGQKGVYSAEENLYLQAKLPWDYKWTILY